MMLTVSVALKASFTAGNNTEHFHLAFAPNKRINEP